LRRSALALLEEGYSQKAAERPESHCYYGLNEPINQSLTDGLSHRLVLVHPYGLVDLRRSIGILTDHTSHRLENRRHHGLAKQELERDSDDEEHDRANSSSEQTDNSAVAGLHRINR
jgi:hypothetical protein